MNLSQLIKQIDDIESNAPSFKRYINESVYNAPEMSKHWRKLDEGFVKGYDQYLKEVALTPDQIQNIFKQASSGAAGGDAAKDPGKLAAIVDKVLPTSQAANLEKSLPEPDAGPVQGFEQKAGAAIQGLQVDSGTKQSLMQMIKAGVSKPETQQLILAAVGAGLGSLISKVGPILSMIPGGGPVASAITGAVVAGGVAVLAAKLRGEDWKSAFKGAIKPALMGGASAVVGNLVTTAVGTMMSGSGGEQPASTDNPKASSGQGAVNADPDAPVGGGMKNGDGTPMTNADMKKAMDQVAPVAGGDADPNKYYNSLSPEQQRAADDAVVAQAQSAGGIEPRGGWGAQEKINAAMQAKADAGIDPATNQPYAQPNSGATAGGVPIGSTPDGINRLTGKPIEPSPPPGQSDWSQGNRDQYPGGLGQYYKDHPNVRGLHFSAVNNADPSDPAVMAQIQARQAYLKQHPEELQKMFGDGTRNFEESLYNKQATLKEWLKRDAQGQSVNSVQLYPYVVEGIMDSLKGMFGGKKDAAAPAAGGGVTADALNQAWTAAGSPTDSEEVAKVLQGAGVPADTVKKIFTDLKLPAPGATPAAPEKVEPTMDPATAPTADPAATPADPAQQAAGAPGAETPAGATAPATPGAEPPATPQADKQSKIGVGQINKIVPTLRVRDLKSVQKNVDTTLAKRSQPKQPTAESKYTGFYSKFLGKEI